MYEKQFIADAVTRSAKTEVDRRKLFTMLGVAGAGAAATTILGAEAANAAGTVDDGAVLNFALNLEYLEAEFYLRAVTGQGLESTYTSGSGDRGQVTGGHKVPFKTKYIKEYASEIAHDEFTHVRFLRRALGESGRVARPAIDLKASFTAAARAAGVVGPKGTFDPFKNETNFLLGAFLFEDVGVTAYKGAAGLIANKTYLEAAAGILSVEAYHAATIRSTLFRLAEKEHSLFGVVKKLSDARDSLDGKSNSDQPIQTDTRAAWLGDASNIVPTDVDGIVYSRTPGQVLNIVYLNPAKGVTKGGFFPNGANGVVAST